MDSIDTETVTQHGQRYRITVYPDADAPNPLKDWPQMGHILSLNRQHTNFDPAAIEAAIETNPDAVPLSHFEHGRCLWSVAGESPAAAGCRWDSVAFAGIWLPDAGTLESARPYGGFTRRQFLRKRARQACEMYTDWCNGDVYGFEVTRISTCPCCGEERAETVDSCWGFYDLAACRAEAMAMLPEESHQVG